MAYPNPENPSLKNPYGVSYGEVQRPPGKLALLPEKAMAWMEGAGPTHAQDRGLVRGVPSPVRGAVDTGGPRPLTYGEGLKQGLPDSSAVVSGTHDDVRHALSQGRYASAVVKGLRGSAALLPAVLNDTVGAAARSLRNPAEDAVRGLFGMEDRSDTPAAAPRPTTSSLAYQPNPTDQRLAAGTQRSPLGGPAAQPGQPSPGPGPNDPRIQERPGQSKLYTNVPDGGLLGNDKLMNRGQISTQNMAAADAMDAQQHQESVGRLRQAQYTSEVQRAQALNQGEALRQSEGKRAQLMDQLQSRQVGARKSARLALDAMDRQDQNANQRRSTDLNYDATLRGHDVSMYGHNVQMAGHQASLKNTRAKLQYDMAKDQRDYNLNVEKYGVEKSSNALKQRESSEKGLREQILGQLPLVPDKDGKMVPDEQGAAQYMRGAYARLGERETALRRALAQDPKNEMAAAELESLQHYGVASLSTDPAAKDQFLTGMQARNAARQSAGWMPWSGDRTNSDRPITSLRRDNGTIFEGYRDQDNNWIPARTIDSGGDWFGARSDKYNRLKME